MSARKVAATTLGCKVNQYDTNAMLEALEKAGFEISPWDGPADVRLVNTCTVTAVADAKSRQMIRKASRVGAVVCVCGCLAEKDAEAVRAMEGVSAVICMDHRQDVVRIVREALGDSGAEQSKSAPLGVQDAGLRTRGVLKVQEGCGNFCTYCVIPHVRGIPVSRSEREILSEARRMVDNGVREIVVTGIHICSYGRDTGESLLELLARMDEVPGVERIRLGSLEPGFLSEGAVRVAAGLKHLCPHFHVSLQSGCEKTLSAMGRRYRPEEYAAGVELLREYFDSPAICTDVMTGFPGESEQDFQDSLEFVRGIHFARCHVFPYSEREGTPAATMPGAVPKAVRKSRAHRMMEACAESHMEYCRQFIGTEQAVLLDKEERCGFSGYTDRYVRVWAPSGTLGAICDVRIADMGEGAMLGEPVEGRT